LTKAGLVLGDGRSGKALPTNNPLAFVSKLRSGLSDRVVTTREIVRFPSNDLVMKSTAAIYQLTDRLHDGRTVHVSADEIGPTVSGWLAELGVTTPVVEDLAQAVRDVDWPRTHVLCDYLSVQLTEVANISPPRVRQSRLPKLPAHHWLSLRGNQRREPGPLIPTPCAI
jgi:hypothetical protein